MTNRNTILNELKGLESTLGNYNPPNVYEVPNGYFEQLPARILNRIRALEATDADEELNYLSGLLSNVSKEMPYTVPAGFFQNPGDDIMQKINEHTNHETSKEEIKNLSPLLDSLKDKNPYSVPAGYFESLATKVVRKDSLGEKEGAKVISITRRRWYRLAVAAVFIGVVAISGLLFIKTEPDPKKNPGKWISNNVTKKVSEEKIDEFVKLAEDGTAEESDAAKQAEIKELMKDVSEKEIEDFLNDAIALESNDTDALMN